MNNVVYNSANRAIFPPTMSRKRTKSNNSNNNNSVKTYKNLPWIENPKNENTKKKNLQKELLRNTVGKDLSYGYLNEEDIYVVKYPGDRNPGDHLYSDDYPMLGLYKYLRTGIDVWDKKDGKVLSWTLYFNEVDKEGKSKNIDDWKTLKVKANYSFRETAPIFRKYEKPVELKTQELSKKKDKGPWILYEEMNNNTRKQREQRKANLAAEKRDNMAYYNVYSKYSRKNNRKNRRTTRKN